MAFYLKLTTKSGKTRWRAVIHVRPLPRISRTFDTRDAARRWAEIKERELRLTKNDKSYNQEIYFFHELVARQIASFPQPLSPHHKKSARILTAWCETIGAIPLSHCTPPVISAALEKIAGKNFNKRSKSTVRQYLIILSILFNRAVNEWRLMLENPVNQVKWPAPSPARQTFLSAQQTADLLLSCRQCNRKPLFLIVLLALATGARKNELLTLKWSQLDLDEGVAELKKTKSGKPRTLYIRGSALAELKRFAENSDQCGYVFRHRRTHRRHMTIDQEWRAAVKRAGIDDFRFHDLRHTCASWMAADGASLLDIGAVLGHSSPAMTQRYAHLTKTHLAEAVAKTVEHHLTIEGLT